MTPVRLRAARLLLGAVVGFALAAVVAGAVAGPILAPSPPYPVTFAPETSAVTSSPTLIRPTTTPAGTPTGNVLDVDGKRALDHLAFFAAPAQGGRYTASAGYDRSATYMADRLAEIGVEPWGDSGTFFQRFRMPLVDLAATPVLARTGPDAKSYRHRVDFTERVGGTFGSGTVDGPLVFIGSGITSGPASDFDAVDVRGKVAMVITGGRADPARDLAARGALAAIYVSSGTLLKFSYISRFEGTTIPGIVVTTSVADELLAPSGKRVSDLIREVQAQGGRTGSSPAPASPAFELSERVRVSVPLTPVREVQATNVVGLLRGSDPDAAKRAVIVGGHLDGVGTDPDGTVFQAANDNASGPAVTIELARALAVRKAELRSSVIFVAFAGEEQGALGSERFVEGFSAIPGRRESLIGYVNLDVVGCCGATISASVESDAMVERVQRAAERLGLSFARGGRGGSDQESFNRRGVPGTLLNWSDIGTIHSTDDTIDKITADRLTTIGRVAALVVLEMAAGP
ncbi:MAG: M20/M25/M40 family metallo-hydrolase [Chloroflexi bacterium]|nr:M20/M25/M40 family metallo-hydrolase [Chloroflexota bacterium]